MKFLSVRDLRSQPAEVWKGLAAAGEMVVTSDGRPIAVLSAVTEDPLEETLAAIRHAKAVAAVTEIQRRSAGSGRDAVTADEIETEIAAARSARGRRDDLPR